MENRPDTLLCHECEGEAHRVRLVRPLRIGARSVEVEDEIYRCACGEEFYAPGMMDDTLRRATAKIRTEDGLLAPDEVKAIRTRLGLTQPEFERLLGVGKNTVVRWERGTVPQSAATDSLLRLIERFPENAPFLAERHGVSLPGAGAAQVRT